MDLRLRLSLGTYLSSGVTFAPPAISFDFTSSLPADWAVTRSGTSATFMDASGVWQVASANSARVHHDPDGTPRGILIEPARTSKCTNRKFNPTDTTNMTQGGDAAAVLSVVPVPAGWLEAVGLQVLNSNGNVYLLDNTAGTGTAVVDFGGTVGNTNPHSCSIYAAGTTNTYVGTITIVGNADNTPINSSTPKRLTYENKTPNATSRQMRISAAAGKAIYFIGNQMEEGVDVSSPIYSTAAATATRSVDDVYVEPLGTMPWFNQSAGAIIMECRLNGNKGLTDQGMFAAFKETDSNNYVLGVHAVATYGTVEGNYKSAGTDYSVNNISSAYTDRDFACGVIWDGGGNAYFFNTIGMRFRKVTVPLFPDGILDSLFLGRVTRYYGYASITIKNMKVWNTSVGLDDIASTMLTADDALIAFAGQSQAEGASYLTGFLTNGGEVAAVNEMDNYWTTGRNALANHAVGGAGMFYRNNTVAYFYENDGVTPGPVLTNTLEALQALKGNIKALLWIQGSTDVSAESKSTLKSIWLQVLTEMRNACGGSIPVFIGDSCRRGDTASAEIPYETWNEIVEELAAENDWIYELPTTKDVPMVAEWNSPAWVSGVAYAVGDTVRYSNNNYYCRLAHTSSGSILPTNTTYWIQDNVHVNDAGQATLCKRNVRRIASVLGKTVLGPVMGSEVNNVVRTGTSVTVTLAHPSGITDITPTTGIEGFVFTDNGTPITITSAVRTNATTVTLTLASAPTSGVEVLKYAYGTCYGVNYTKLLRGNDANTLPVKPFKFNLT